MGTGKLLDPQRLVRVFVSPRVRAVRTLELLLQPSSGVVEGKVTHTNEITEWDYGDYEGLTDQEIRLRRKNKGLDVDKEWNIWSDGCEGGEYVYPGLALIAAIANILKIKGSSHRAAGRAYHADQRDPGVLHA